ncbi:hypothetical protein PR202_ga28416 [Eleusine coracana subsp. coracana]|uniref:BPM/SPOP BACK domain-containing protein n=1 Tax=Eleusine coracana subsp. coracana TaxID=191504 RepID=A0AAV5DKA7_ELECO|nr:hypothetical protein PR202_ga28416 [Eleusine coracana subsp. coracana]
MVARARKLSWQPPRDNGRGRRGIRGVRPTVRRAQARARSPVISFYKEDFFGPRKEKDTSYIRLCDLNPEAYNILLRYIYTDTLPQMLLSSGEEGPVLAEGLLVAADRYSSVRNLLSFPTKLLHCSQANSAGRNDSKKRMEGVRPQGSHDNDREPDVQEHQREDCVADVGAGGAASVSQAKRKCLGFIASRKNTSATMEIDDVEQLARCCPSVVKEVITKVLEAREKERTELIIGMHVRVCLPFHSYRGHFCVVV